MSRDALLDDVWGRQFHRGSNGVDAVIVSVRRKLGPHAASLRTVRGIGYRFDV